MFLTLKMQIFIYHIFITNKKSPLIHTYYIATSPIKEVTSCIWEVGIGNKLTRNATQVDGFLYCNLRQYPPHINKDHVATI